MAERSVASRVFDIAAPIAERLGLILWDVRFVKEGAARRLRVIIDKDGGVGMQDCVDMSRALDDVLDNADFLNMSYNLQVQSPGPGRELKRPEHFARYIGQSVIIKLHAAYNGVKVFAGELASYDEDTGAVTIILPDDTAMTCESGELAYVKADDDFI